MICFSVGLTSKRMANVKCCNLAANIPLSWHRVFCWQDTCSVVLQSPDILCRPDRNDSFWFLLLWTVNTHDFSNLWSFFQCLHSKSHSHFICGYDISVIFLIQYSLCRIMAKGNIHFWGSGWVSLSSLLIRKLTLHSCSWSFRLPLWFLQNYMPAA